MNIFYVNIRTKGFRGELSREKKKQYVQIIRIIRFLLSLLSLLCYRRKYRIALLLVILLLESYDVFVVAPA